MKWKTTWEQHVLTPSGTVLKIWDHMKTIGSEVSPAHTELKTCTLFCKKVKFKEKVIKTQQHEQLVGLLYRLSEPVVSVPVIGTQTGTYP
jgi:hypothetical protein